MTQSIQRLVNLELCDIQIIRRIAVERGLGGKGFSATVGFSFQSKSVNFGLLKAWMI